MTIYVKIAKRVTKFLSPSFPALTTSCMLFINLPVTVSSAEGSFSKLKIIKTMSQERLDELAVIAIKNEEAKGLELDKLIDEFAQKNARRRENFD